MKLNMIQSVLLTLWWKNVGASRDTIKINMFKWQSQARNN